MATILYDKLHAELPRISDDGGDGFSAIVKELESEGFTVNTSQSDFVEELVGVDAAWISFPTQNFDEAEIEAVSAWVKAGGNLLVTAEWGDIYSNVSVLNSLTKAFGVEFNKDRLTDHVHAFVEEIKVLDEVVGTKKIPQFIQISDFGDHPIVDRLNEIYYFAGCSLNAEEDNIIARTPETSFGDLNANMKWDPGEEKGSVAVATATTPELGRVVCIGDTSFLANKYLDHGDNRAFIVNAFKWLARTI